VLRICCLGSWGCFAIIDSGDSGTPKLDVLEHITLSGHYKDGWFAINPIGKDLGFETDDGTSSSGGDAESNSMPSDST